MDLKCIYMCVKTGELPFQLEQVMRSIEVNYHFLLRNGDELSPQKKGYGWGIHGEAESQP